MKTVKEISEKALRKVTVLVRYFIKATKNVVLYVMNDKGDKYYVTLQRNGVHSCNCKATKSCYHIARARELENARWYKARMAKVHAQEAAEEAAVVEAAQSQDTLPTQPVVSNVVDISCKGNLNGAQQSAGLLMALPSRQKKSA